MQNTFAIYILYMNIHMTLSMPYAGTNIFREEQFHVLILNICINKNISKIGKACKKFAIPCVFRYNFEAASILTLVGGPVQANGDW